MLTKAKIGQKVIGNRIPGKPDSGDRGVVTAVEKEVFFGLNNWNEKVFHDTATVEYETGMIHSRAPLYMLHPARA